MTNLQKLLNSLSDKVVILGHDNIDVDAFLSSILLSNLLSFLGINNEFLIVDTIKEDETFDILRRNFGFNMHDYQASEDSSRSLILLDHYETKHKGIVIACIDHHYTTNPVPQSYPFYYYKPSCSTSYILYELMCEAGYPISKSEAEMILVSMMIDTVSFRSTKTVQAEVSVARGLADQFGIDYEAIEMECLCLTPIDTLSINEIVENGLKSYNYNGNRVQSSYIQIYDMPEEDSINSWISSIAQKVSLRNLEMWVFIIFDLKEGVTKEYHITPGQIEMIQAETILSRGADIMPQIESYFS